MRGNLLGIMVFGFAVMSLAFEANKYITVEVPTYAVEVENGRPFTFSVKLKTAEGVHVNAQPQISVKSETEGISFRVNTIHKDGDHLDPAKPINIECETDGLATGAHRAKFILRYTYCSDTEKWCRMGSESVTVELKVIK
ncbi:MAG: hypothetical protein M1469_06880 [Bacteroidetes bacterium]|nr:hypothetical protein [Bacteroidota bacterium]